MTRDDIKKLAICLSRKIAKNKGVQNLVKNHKRFEGWLQVETVGILQDLGVQDISTEYTYSGLPASFDISFTTNIDQRWAIELKVLTTRYTHNNQLDHYIPSDIGQVTKDAVRLVADNTLDCRLLIVLAYPVASNYPAWVNTLTRINHAFTELCHIDFQLVVHPEIMGVLYVYTNPVLAD